MRNRAVPRLSQKDREYVTGLLMSRGGDGILAINKPSGLAVQTRGNRGRNLDRLLWAFARSNGKRPRLVHRLDTGTSGVILAAETHPVAVHLSRQFEHRVAQKVYLAIVEWDKREAKEGVIEASLKVLENRPKKSIIDEAGKSARTNWRLIQATAAAAILEIKPETGRMHQIRAHLAHIGLPIYGDNFYGGRSAARLMLHATSITVETLEGDRRTYAAATHSDWLMVLDTLGLSQVAP